MSHCWASSLNVTKINYWTEDNNSLFSHCENSRFQHYQPFGDIATLPHLPEKPKVIQEVEPNNGNKNICDIILLTLILLISFFKSQ